MDEFGGNQITWEMEVFRLVILIDLPSVIFLAKVKQAQQSLRIMHCPRSPSRLEVGRPSQLARN
jgi:hypothetical protein